MINAEREEIAHVADTLAMVASDAETLLHLAPDRAARHLDGVLKVVRAEVHRLRAMTQAAGVPS
jgi:hypothetical protein